MNLSTESARQQAWSSYWATGGLHSCLGSFKGNYDGVMGAFWTGVSQLIRPGQRVLDLATGNGAVPLLLLERVGAAFGVRIDAVDLAELAPAWYREEAYPGITFHSRQRIERLPFDRGCFDWICSQFGIEYARRPEAVGECLRVAKPEAGFAFVTHHAESVLVEVARAEFANQQQLLAEQGLLARAAQVLPWLARARSGADLRANVDAVQARQAYNRANALLSDGIQDNRAPDLLLDIREQVHAIVAGNHGLDLETQLGYVVELRDRLIDASVRTSELIQCAMDAAQMTQFIGAFKSALPDATIQCEPLHQSEGLLGWGLLIRVREASADSSRR